MPFKKGQSGNPGGRVGVPAEVLDLARQHSTEAIERLIHWMKSDDGRISVAAANVRSRLWPTRPVGRSGCGRHEPTHPRVIGWRADIA